MRALSSLLSVLASIATVGAIAVRVWWSKPRPVDMRGKPGYYEGTNAPLQDPKAPSWLRTAAKWWLILVVFGATAILLIVVAYTIISLS